MTTPLRAMLFLMLLLVAGAATGHAADAPQATSLFGQPLYTPAPSPETLAKYQAAKADYEADPGNADKLIWYGRRAAYAGDFKEAIRIFSDGVRNFRKMRASCAIAATATSPPANSIKRSPIWKRPMR